MVEMFRLNSALTCRDVIGALDDYTAQTQVDDLRLRFERHLAMCSPCAAYLRAYRSTIDLTKSAMVPRAAALPADGAEKLIQAIRDAFRTV